MRRVLLPALLTVVPLFTATAARADWPTVAGTTTLSGSATGYVTVRLPQPISFPLAGSDENDQPGLKVRLRGSGRLFGAIVREVAPGDDDPAQLMMTSGDGDGDPQDTTLIPVSGFPKFQQNAPPPPYTMPAGEYRLYLLADGAPVQADITFPGYAGAASFAPDVPVPQRLFAMPRVDGGMTPDVAEFGGEGDLGSRGLTIVRPHLSSDAEATARIEPCFFGPDDPPPADPSAFGPGCGDPTWAAQDLVFFALFGEPPMIPPGKSETGWEAWWPDAQAGHWFLGGNVQDVAAPGRIEMFGAWIAYEPAPGTPLPARPSDPPAPATGPPAAPASTGTAPPASRTQPAKHHRKKKAKPGRRCRTAKRKKGAHRRSRSCRRPTRDRARSR